MSIRAEVEAYRIPPGPKCGVCQLLASMPADDSAELADVIGDRTFSAKQIADWICDHTDRTVHYPAVQRHRTGDCVKR